MIDRAEQELRQITKLLEVPTPENYEAVNRKLEYLARFLVSVKDALSSGSSCDSRIQIFMRGLPAEMRNIRTLMQAPIEFFRGMNALPGVYVASYDQSGNVKNFQSAVLNRTVLHL